MNHNGQEPIRLSKVSPNAYSFGSLEGDRPLMIECPVCGLWRPLKRRGLFPHRRGNVEADGRCPGSNQRYIVDVDKTEWKRLLERERDPEVRSVRAIPAGLPSLGKRH